ncbi:MAG: DUF3108 domain-containing protein [Desulfomonilaceae bacterium]|nr:DUF3108 domain-containing protein [Desulfomonilaceae bacterium]
MTGTHATRKSGSRGLALLVLFAAVMAAAPPYLTASEPHEILRYEVTWNGRKAGHGDITTKIDPKRKDVTVTAQAVSDGLLKAVCEIWSRVQATFTAKTFRPKTYSYNLRSNLLRHELVEVDFDHGKKTVNVNKVLGRERETHSEAFSDVYDPITAAFLLRNQKDFTKPMYVDIYDGRDRSRLFVNFMGAEQVKVKTGVHPAVKLGLRLVKLTGEKEELAKGQLWISNDQNRIPLLLTSSPIVGTVRFELVQAH